MTETSCEILRPAAFARRGNMFAVASGKGGVGKTWLAISLAHAFARAGRKTLLFDGDLGLANVDIQLGLMPADDLGGVLAGRLSLPGAVTPFAAGFDIIAGRSGSGRLGSAPLSRLRHLSENLEAIARNYDQVILDLGAGVEQTVRQLTRNADTCLVVLTDEPTSLTDAYAFIKLTHAERPALVLGVVINQAASVKEGERTHTTLRKACEGFLGFTPPLFGIIRRDGKVRETIRAQTPLLTRHPGCEAASDVAAIAQRLSQATVPAFS